MSSSLRRKDLSVVNELFANPANYSFYQTVRILERAAHYYAQQKQLPAPKGIGIFTPPETEFVRFAHQLSMGFPASEVAKIERKKNDRQQQYLLMVNFMGMIGSTGILPFHYTEMIFQRLKLKDVAIKKFFDLFHHRTTSLFFKAGTKYRLPLAYERHTLANNRYERFDSHTQALLSLIGLGTPHLTEGLSVKPESLLFYSGLLSQGVKSSTNLRQFLSSFFEVPVKIEEFVGQWHDLIDDVRSRLPYPGNPRGQNACLGRSVILGGKGWFAQGKMRVVLGPLNEEQYRRFGPGTRALKQLNQMVKHFAGAENESEFVIQVAREHVPHRIQLNGGTPPVMGWDTWLATKPLPEERVGETLDIHVSSGRLQ